MFILRILLAVVMVAAGCNAPTSIKTECDKQDSVNATRVSESAGLPKHIVVFLGRGGCCYGHIISVDKNGNLQYSVGTYSIPITSDTYLPEIFDPERVAVDRKYAQKNKRVSAEVLERLGQLVRDEEKLRFRDKSLVEDAYHYNIYLDNKGIAYGYDVKIKSFPANLREFITLVIGQVELHKLPGTA